MDPTVLKLNKEQLLPFFWHSIWQSVDDLALIGSALCKPVISTPLAKQFTSIWKSNTLGYINAWSLLNLLSRFFMITSHPFTYNFLKPNFWNDIFSIIVLDRHFSNNHKNYIIFYNQQAAEQGAAALWIISRCPVGYPAG